MFSSQGFLFISSDTPDYGRVGIDAQQMNKDLGLIVEEVIERLTRQVGCKVDVTRKIHAKRLEGFDERTI